MRNFYTKNLLSGLIMLAALLSGVGFASGSHDDHENEKNSQEHGHEEEGHDEKGDAHSKDESHGHESESASAVGQEKGIIAANEKDGFKISPEATKNFKIQTMSLPSGSTWSVPSTAIAYSAREVNVYRFRDGFYKRIDFKLLSKEGNSRRISSTDLRAGDAVVISGLGFLRVAEIAAFGGAPEGHAH